MEDRPVNITITAGTVVKAVIILAIAALLFSIRNLILIVFTAIVIASAIEPAILSIMRWKLPRLAAVLFVYILLLAGLGILFYFFLPIVVGDLAAFISSLPQYIQSVTHSEALSQYGSIIDLSKTSVSPSDIISALNIQGLASAPLSAAVSIFGGIFSFLLILVLSFYFAVLDTGVDDFLRLVCPRSYQPYVLTLWRRSQRKIGLWMQGQLLLGALMGVLVFLGLTIFNVPHALLLAVLTALFEIIPVFGIIFAGAVAVSVAFATGGLSLSLIILAFYIIAQQFESNLIYPLVVTRIVGIPPILVILAIVIGADLAGFLGVILSVPIAATLRELARDYEAGTMPSMMKKNA